MKRTAGIAVGVLWLGFTQAVAAYEQPTHEWMTHIAFQRSILVQDPAFLANIGVHGSYKSVRNSDGAFADVDATLAFGAYHEDDFPRPLYHFYDVQHGGAGLPSSLSSPDWTLEDTRVITKQLYSVRHARDHFYQALVSSAQQRPMFLGLTFETLGHALHHVQDMAQPQHVRNDKHLTLFGLEPSLYETYSLEQSDANRLPSTAPGYEGAVDLAVFDRARKFWSNGGAGMAEFTSHNFISKDTNFELDGNNIVHANANQPLPAAQPCPGRDFFTQYNIESPELLGPSQFLRGRVRFAGTQVHDAYQPATDACNPRMSMLSVFENDLLLPLDGALKFSVNDFTFDAAHRFLIPRAIAYSAGFINHFFRGRVRIESVSGAGFSVSLQVRNISPADFSLADGTDPKATREFEVWYDAVGGVRKPATITSGGDLAGATLASGGSTHTIQFIRPEDVDPNSRIPFVLVFRGTVGSEEGIIGQTFTITPVGFIVNPSYVSSDGVSGPRVLQSTGSTWQVFAPTTLVAGNVDWRGWRADDLVTWDGPRTRYWGTVVNSSHIYYGGRVLANEPTGTGVLGASIRYEGATRMLNVAVYASGSVSVYTRLFRDSYPNDGLYNASTNPLGWRLLVSAPAQMPKTPMFFNASGTEAQTLMNSNQRLKISLASGASSTTSSRGRLTVTEVSATNSNLTTNGHDTCSFPNRYDGECTAVSSCPDGGSICSSVRYDAGTTSLTDFSHSMHPTGIEPAIVCVDYRGDIEVLCRFTIESEMFNSYHVSSIYNGHFTGSSSACGQSYSYGGVSESLGSLTWEKTENVVYRLTAGGLSLELYGSKERATMSNSTTVNRLPPLISGTSNYSTNDVVTSLDSPLLYLDLRHDIAVYVANTRVDTTIGSGSVALVNNAGNLEFPSPSVPQVTTFTHELIVQIAGKQSVYKLDSAQTSVSTADVGSPAGSGAGCANSSSDSAGPVVSSEFIEPSVFFDERVLQSSITAAAVDGAGHVLISVPFLTRDNPFSFPQLQGVYNFISNSDLATLIPGAPANSQYGPIGLLR